MRFSILRREMRGTEEFSTYSARVGHILELRTTERRGSATTKTQHAWNSFLKFSGYLKELLATAPAVELCEDSPEARFRAEIIHMPVPESSAKLRPGTEVLKCNRSHSI